MEFCEKFDETTSSQKTSYRTQVFPTVSFLAAGAFNR